MEKFRITRLQDLVFKVGSNAQLGRKLGYQSGAYIGQMISGDRPITEKFISKAESIFGCKGWFSNVENDTSDNMADLGFIPSQQGVIVPILSATASMGPGEHYDIHDTFAGSLVLSPVWISENIKQITGNENLRFIHAYGDSMEPTFKSGDVLLVDAGVHSMDVDGIYVLFAQERMFIKRVTQDVFGTFTISSDNPKVTTVSVLSGESSVSIMARVLWTWEGKRMR